MGWVRWGWVVAALLAIASPRTARAFCGFYVAGADAKLFNNATLVVMMRDGTRTVLSMQNNYQGPPENFAMVVPVPVVLQKENVKTLPREIFDHVDTMAAPRLVEYWEQDPCAQPSASLRSMASPAPMAAAAEKASDGPGALGVKIEAQFTVGEYEIVVLSANDSMGLETWLRQEKYSIPPGAEPLLRPYVSGGMKFFVAKVDVTKVKFEKGMAMLSPLRFHYDTDSFNLPVRLGLVNSNGTQDLLVHILARNQRYEVANYPNTTIPTNLDVAEEARAQFGPFYAALFDRTLERNPKAVVTEYAWTAQSCDPCPGPTLTPAEIITLGADVLPSSLEAPKMPVITVATTQEFRREAYQFQSQVQNAVQRCFMTALQKNPGLKGKIKVTVGEKPTSFEGEEGFPPAELGECMKTALKALPTPRSRNEALAGTLSVTFDSAPTPPNTWDFVLTRLHARYGKDSLGEDLVFRQAPAIVGGREVRDVNQKLEHASQPSSMNNFQARYAIRHPWNGPMACAQPKRGVWGGPPNGERGDTGATPARDLAFAPRGGVKLASFLRQDVPELGLTRSAGGCGACEIGAGAPRGGAAALAGLVAAALACGIRRRRTRTMVATWGDSDEK